MGQANAQVTLISSNHVRLISPLIRPVCSAAASFYNCVWKEHYRCIQKPEMTLFIFNNKRSIEWDIKKRESKRSGGRGEKDPYVVNFSDIFRHVQVDRERFTSPTVRFQMRTTTTLSHDATYTPSFFNLYNGKSSTQLCEKRKKKWRK